MVNTMEAYLKAKLDDVEVQKRQIEFELFTLKNNGVNRDVAAASQKIHEQNTTIATLQDALAAEKKYSANLKSTVENLKQAGGYQKSQMTSAQKTASGKNKAAAEKIEKLQNELDEKSKEVVKFRTEWKRVKFDYDTLRAAFEAKDSVKRKWGDLEDKKRAYQGDDEDDEEPLKKRWMNRKDGAVTDGVAKIKLEEMHGK